MASGTTFCSYRGDKGKHSERGVKPLENGLYSTTLKVDYISIDH